MFAVDDWRREWTAEDHLQRQHFARSCLQRNLRGEAHRRVSSSSVSSTVALVDCCWARGQCACGAAPAATTALSTYLFSILSDGTVCILNTTNFTKTYLFGNESSRKGRRDSHVHKKDTASQHNWQRGRLAAIDCFPLCKGKRELLAARGATRSAATLGADEWVTLVCSTVEEWICAFVVDPDTLAYARSVNISAGKVHKIIELPSNSIVPGKGEWKNAHIRFSPTGRRIFVVVSFKTACSRLATFAKGTYVDPGEGVEYFSFFCILARQGDETPEAYTVEKQWTCVQAPDGKSSVNLLHVSWWGAVDCDLGGTILAVWSDGTVSFMDTSLEIVAHTSVFSSSVEQIPGQVTMATSAINFFQKNLGDTHSAPHQNGLLAMVLDGNIVVVFTVQESLQPCLAADGDDPPLKIARNEAQDCGAAQARKVTLCPGHQTYCSEDISVCDLALFENFLPYTLVVLLESGALVAFDTVTMELLYHRPLRRLFSAGAVKTSSYPTRKHKSEVADKESDGVMCGGGGGCNFFLRPRERPLAMCVVEHNTAVLLRPS